MTGIQLNNSYDLDIRSGSIRVGDTTYQNQALIIGSHKGEFKEQPAVGVGISDMLLDHNPLAWRQNIREQLEIDGQNVRSVQINKTGVTINAHYI